ncbi:hypothetical protein [Streptomyces sp. NPDC051561]|uniref:hypothetical protein n=1 Tax=Streptomyces sp. NPDC051561 TaxID=3365658 RepID=UPI0037A43524
MTTSAIPALTPIYDLLVQELGDALTESRIAAQQTQDEAQQALDWSGLRPATAQRQERAFSAFGHARSSEHAQNGGQQNGGHAPSGQSPALPARRTAQ